jgi:Zn-dependent protease with chaperone function
MERADFIRLVEQCEHQVQAQPRAFRRKLRLWMSLGTLYMVFLFFVGLLGSLACVAMLALSIYHRTGVGCMFWVLVLVGVPSVLLVYGTLRALFVRIHPHPGKDLGPAEFPRLHQEVAEICQALSAPPIHRIVLADEDSYASVRTEPSRWLFGRLRNTLVLDIAMLTTHSHDDVKAFMAHEVGHVLGGDTRLGMKLGGVMTRWGAVVDALHREEKEPLKLVSRFLDWYIPRLMARRLALSREQEVHADATISKIISPQAAAAALVALELKARARSEIVPEKLRDMVRESEAPPAAYYHLMRMIVNDSNTYEKADEWIVEALKVPTEYGDTHPALRDRLKAILGKSDLTPQILRDMGCWPDLNQANAAEHYLGDQMGMVLAEYSAAWSDSIRESWAYTREARDQDAKRLEEIEQRIASAEGSLDEEFERAMILEREGRVEEAAGLIEAILERDPDMRPAQFTSGRMMLHRNEPEGLRVFHDLVMRDPRWGPDCYELVYHYHLRNGSQQAAREAEKRYDESVRILTESHEERSVLTLKDQFLPAALPVEKLEATIALLAQEKKVRRAWWLRKKVSVLPQFDCHLLVVEYDTGWLPRGEKFQQKKAQELVDKLPLPEDTWLWLNPHRQVRGLKRKIRNAAGKPVYDRREWKRFAVTQQ